MELLRIDCLGKELRLEGSMAGWQQLFWAGEVVAVKHASAENQGSYTHEFELTITNQQEAPTQIKISLEINLNWQPFQLTYRLLKEQQVLTEGSRNSKDIEQQIPLNAPPTPRKFSFLGLASLGFKLLKSAKVIKVILVGASIAAYSWLFSIQFALTLIACLVFHEYGHIKAMKYFGLKTKGIYLIPFIGGLAMSDEKINTRWQDIVISIMGPTFGLLMSLVALILYWLTDESFFAGLAAFNALLNLFNLLPILPLDGGHILKSISFSMNSLMGLVACIAGAAIGVYLSYYFEMALLGFMLLIGSVEIIFEWKTRHQSHLLPLDRYGQIFSIIWYLLTVGALIAIIWYFASSGDEILGLPLKVLQS